MFFVQMAGFPGSGKSTVAREIAKRTRAVIIDHDIVKTALMQFSEGTANDKATGSIAYGIEWSLIDVILSQGHSVIHDSPCFYVETVDKRLELCNKYDAIYKYVECYLDDMIEINRRLGERDRMISQIGQIGSEERFKRLIADSKKPADRKCLVVDSSQPPERYMERVLEYIRE
ncbi:AAA family ATPase [Paenibacillus hamazuiensis]|uniref:AAA family ATPase n=1 Tax=Paenibacillus hamazuiensis TaxID=2936508 RepID=UPI00200EE0A4|nr:AAA family ATPase [Paenibacillus hamazuiensis]